MMRILVVLGALSGSISVVAATASCQAPLTELQDRCLAAFDGHADGDERVLYVYQQLWEGVFSGEMDGDPDLVLEAIEYGTVRHDGQYRKGEGGAPHIIHPMRVALSLYEVACVRDPEVLAAAVLHDTVEDAGATFDEIAARFGPRVCALVAEVTDDPRVSREVQKQQQIKNAPLKSPGAQLIKLGDKVDNIRDFPEAWPIEKQIAYATFASEVVAGLRGVSPELEAIFDELISQHLAHV